MSRKQVLENTLKFVERITDRNYQERVWVKGEGPERGDFEETSCFFLEQCELILKDDKELNISEDQHRLLSSFYKTYEDFSDEMAHLPAQLIISDPRWKNIRELAEEVLKAFHYEKHQKSG